MHREIMVWILFVTTWQSALCQQANFVKIADLPGKIVESSGLEFTGTGNVWTIVDSNYPVLYCLDVGGKLKRTIYLNNLNHGWEDLTKDKGENFYIGDFGNNSNNRRDLKIYKLPSPDSLKDQVVTAEIISYVYEDQKYFPPSKEVMNFDMDAMIHYGSNLYLFSKNRTIPFNGYTKLYRLPDKPGNYKAELLDSLRLGNGRMLQSWVTGAALSPNGKVLALLSHDKVWLLTCFEGERFFKGEIHTINLKHFSQKEGVCFINDNTLLISDERTSGVLGGGLYQLKINLEEYKCSK